MVMNNALGISNSSFAPDKGNPTFLARQPKVAGRDPMVSNSSDSVAVQTKRVVIIFVGRKFVLTVSELVKRSLRFSARLQRAGFVHQGR
jgi:hypothetical protein